MSWRRILRILGWGLVLLVGGTVSYEYAAAHHPAAERAALLTRGRALYGTLCHDCHGDRMEGRVLPTTGEVVPPLSKRGFRFFFYTMPSGMEGFVADRIGNARAGIEGLTSDLTGRGQSAMPEFGHMLSREDRAALALYIHAVNVGDAAAP
jgi:mono/diheme cytochrome c family protein